jgi:tRNA dimethylallyltransferase
LSKKIILLAGPTASGKSKLAIYLAKKINGEIINADSMQIYKEFTILSSRPKRSEVKKIKHHMYGIVSVKRYFSAGDWFKEAKKKVDLCLKNKKVPIIVGGTGLYFNTITGGISKIPDIDFKTRKNVRVLFKKLGSKKFYEKLLVLDPKVKNRINPKDSQRMQRAYEVKLKTKKSLFDWFTKTKSDFLDFDLRKVFIDIPRMDLLPNISKRTELMFKENCLKEVKKFNSMRLNKSLSANKLIGVQEINEFIKDSISLDECKELINIKTRQYAKRQNTWARGHMKNWNKLYSKNFSILLKKTLKVIS